MYTILINKRHIQSTNDICNVVKILSKKRLVQTQKHMQEIGKQEALNPKAQGKTTI